MTQDLSSQLTDKQKLFADIYVQTNNVLKAYMEAYNATYMTAQSAAYRTKNIPHVRAYINSELEKKIGSKEDTIGRLVTLAEFDLSEFIDKDWNLDLAKLKRSGLGWVLKGVTKTKYGKTWHFRDFDKAFEQLLRVQGLFNDSEIVQVNIEQKMNSRDLLLQRLEMVRNNLEKSESIRTDSTTPETETT